MDDYTVTIPKNTRKTIRPRGTPLPPNKIHKDKKKYNRKRRYKGGEGSDPPPPLNFRWLDDSQILILPPPRESR
jgi:hypothetical protein